jgi:epoxyqueuosine reductase QueG
MGNAGERRYLPVLQGMAQQDPDEMVREAARWAIEAIERKR